MLKFIKRLAKLVLEWVKELFLKNDANDLSTISTSYSNWQTEIIGIKDEEISIIKFQESLKIIGNYFELLQHKEKETSDFDVDIKWNC